MTLAAITFIIADLALILAGLSVAAIAEMRWRQPRPRCRHAISNPPTPTLIPEWLPTGWEFHPAPKNPEACENPISIVTLEGFNRIVECGECAGCLASAYRRT